MKRHLSLLLLPPALAALAMLAPAKIIALDLPAMVERCDDAIVGKVVERSVIRIDHPIDGPELYFTTLLIEGRSLETGLEAIAQVRFPGGFVTKDEGAFNSESPHDPEVQIGNEIVAFYGWTNNMGGDLEGNRLIAAHGGLYPVQTNRAGERIVLGRGPGYAVSKNVLLSELETQIRELADENR